MENLLIIRKFIKKNPLSIANSMAHAMSILTLWLIGFYIIRFLLTRGEQSQYQGERSNPKYHRFSKKCLLFLFICNVMQKQFDALLLVKSKWPNLHKHIYINTISEQLMKIYYHSYKSCTNKNHKLSFVGSVNKYLVICSA